MHHRLSTGLRAGVSLTLIVAAGAWLGVQALAEDEHATEPGYLMVQAGGTRVGQAALDQFFLDHKAELAPLEFTIDRGGAIEPTEAQRALLDELDALANQRDALWSRLYWHTDLEEALAEARAAGKPVLSLRLLGRLDESLSCANSRYFRAVLYPNAEISAYLREHYVLHWHTVRPAPVMTVDFGNGRVLKQTITGNSVHYVLNNAGEVVDALPGLYTPQAFLRSLRTAESMMPVRSARSTAIPAVFAQAPEPEFRSASEAGDRALSKSFIEFRPLRNVLPERVVNDPALLLAAMPASTSPGPVLDARARSLVCSQLGDSDFGAMEPDRVIEAFEASVRADAALNTGTLRPQILALLEDASLRASPTKLDDRVYDEVFLSPITDQWAGLVDPTAFSGLWARDRMPGG